MTTVAKYKINYVIHKQNKTGKWVVDREKSENKLCKIIKEFAVFNKRNNFLMNFIVENEYVNIEVLTDASQ